MNDVLVFIIDHLSERGVSVSTENYAGFEYLSDGVIDSFEVLTLVMALDAEFSVKLEPEDMLSAESKTVDGLANLITSRIS